MTSAWKGLETLTAWSDDMRLSFDSKGRRVVCTFTFNMEIPCVLYDAPWSCVCDAPSASERR